MFRWIRNLLPTCVDISDMKQHARNDLGSTTGELTQANFEKLAIIKDELNVNQQTFSFSLRRRKRSNDDIFTVKAQHSCIGNPKPSRSPAKARMQF